MSFRITSFLDLLLRALAHLSPPALSIVFSGDGVVDSLDEIVGDVNGDGLVNSADTNIEGGTNGELSLQQVS